MADRNGPLFVGFIDGFAEGVVGHESRCKLLALDGQQQCQAGVAGAQGRRLTDEPQTAGVAFGILLELLGQLFLTFEILDKLSLVRGGLDHEFGLRAKYRLEVFFCFFQPRLGFPGQLLVPGGVAFGDSLFLLGKLEMSLLHLRFCACLLKLAIGHRQVLDHLGTLFGIVQQGRQEEDKADTGNAAHQEQSCRRRPAFHPFPQAFAGPGRPRHDRLACQVPLQVGNRSWAVA